MVEYQWGIESVESTTGDTIETFYGETIGGPAGVGYLLGLASTGERHRIKLIRAKTYSVPYVPDQVWWAYPAAGRLPKYFTSDDQSRVVKIPKRFQKELSEWYIQKAKECQ